MPTAKEYVALRAPQWALDPRLDALIAEESPNFSTTKFGRLHYKAVALKVLHIFATEVKGGGNPGTGTNSGTGTAAYVTEEREDTVSVSYSAPIIAVKFNQSSDLNLNGTQYGMELISLIKTCIAGGPITRAAGWDLGDIY